MLSAHYEIAYDVAEARTNRLTFQLPADTPGELAIRGLDGLSIKESSSKLVDGPDAGPCCWESRVGEHSAVGRFSAAAGQPGSRRKNANRTDLALGASAGRGLSVGHGGHRRRPADRDVQVKTSLRKVDVGELAEADYQPGRRLLGAFGYGGDAAEVQVLVARPAEYELPTAIVDRAELLTVISPSGRSQTVARFHLRAKALLIEVQLPTGSTLWSAYLDSQPTLPQREAGSLLIALPAAAEARRSATCNWFMKRRLVPSGASAA